MRDMKKMQIFITALCFSAGIAHSGIEGDTVTPVSAWKDGFTRDQSQLLRQQYSVHHMRRGDDAGVYWSTNLSEILPSKRVSRMGPVAGLEMALRPELADLKAKSALGTLSLRQLMVNEQARFRGIVVVHRGHIVFEEYPGMREFDSQVWFSTTKPITALLIELLREQGVVDTDDSIAQYIDEFRGTDWERVKVINLLHMASGMDIVENEKTLADPNSPVARAFAATLVGKNDEGESLMNILSSVSRTGQPGDAFEYSTFNTQILGALIERVTGSPFGDILTKYLWSRVGMEGDGLMALSPSGETLNGGIFSARLRDLARFGILYTPSWNLVASERLVSDDYLRRIQDSANADSFMKGHQGPRLEREFGERPSHNAFQWDAVFADGDLYKAGRNGQCLYVSPSKDIVVTWFAATLDNALFYPAYARAIARHLAAGETANGK
jgi:CubicO group peptidase (beta-lactamase class C family)